MGRFSVEVTERTDLQPSRDTLSCVSTDNAGSHAQPTSCITGTPKATEPTSCVQIDSDPLPLAG